MPLTPSPKRRLSYEEIVIIKLPSYASASLISGKVGLTIPTVAVSLEATPLSRTLCVRSVSTHAYRQTPPSTSKLWASSRPRREGKAHQYNARSHRHRAKLGSAIGMIDHHASFPSLHIPHSSLPFTTLTSITHHPSPSSAKNTNLPQDPQPTPY